MSEKRSKVKTIASMVEIQSAATQRILDSMPVLVDEIKAARERDAWKLRKAVRQLEKAKMRRGPGAGGPFRSKSSPPKE